MGLLVIIVPTDVLSLLNSAMPSQARNDFDDITETGQYHSTLKPR